jgi:hypothetical protein
MSQDMSEDILAAYVTAAKSQTTIGKDITAEGLGNITSAFDGWTFTETTSGTYNFQLNTWSTEANDASADPSGMVVPFIEHWVDASAAPITPGNISYTISGLVPNLYYTVSALIRAYNQASTNTPSGAYFYVGTGKSDDVSTGTTFTNGSMGGVYGTFSAYGKADSNGDLTIGIVENSDNNFNWIAIKEVSAQIAAEKGLSDLQDAFAALQSQADAIKNKPMNSSVSNALATAYTTPTEETTAAYESAISALTTAIDDANTSIKNYAAALEYINKASALDADGIANYASDETVSSVTSAYNNSTLVKLTDEQITAMKTAYVTAVKAQTSENADFTGAIVNPSFETGNTNGWTVGTSEDTGARSTTNDIYKMSGSDGNYLFNTWSVGLPITQTIEGLPNGTYRLTATVASDNTIAIFLTANGMHNSGVVSTEKGTGVETTLDFYVTDGTATIGSVGGNGTEYTVQGGNWYKVDNFKLTLLSLDVPVIDLGEPTFTEKADKVVITFADYADQTAATSANNKYVINATVNGTNYTNTTSADNGAVVAYDFTGADSYTIVIPENGIKLLDANDDEIAVLNTEKSYTTVYSSSLVNTDFGTDNAVAATVRTYSNDIANEGETSGMQSVTGWTICAEGTSNNHAAGTFEYGATAGLGGVDYLAPTEGPTGTNGKALGVLAVWSATSQYTQTIRMTEGEYMIAIPTYNQAGTAEVTNLTGVSVDGVTNYSSVTAFTAGAWTYQFVEFTLTNTSLVTFSLGYKSNGGGSGANPHLFYDKMTIYSGAEDIASVKLDFAKANALAAIQTLSPIGDGLFQYSQASIDNAKKSINDATTLDELNSVEQPSVTTPSSTQAYQIAIKESGKFMTVSAEGIKLGNYAQPLYFVSSNDGYLISNGEEYVAYLDNNKWDLTASQTGSEFVISATDAAYNIKGKNGHLGVNNTNAGSTLYGDKAATEWTINEFSATDFIVNGAVTVESYETLTANKVTVEVSTDNNTNAIINNGVVNTASAVINLTIPYAQWSFVKFPCDVPVSELVNSESGTEWKIYKYDGAARANVDVANTWVAVTSGTLEEGEGYIIQARHGEETGSTTFTFTTTSSESINKIFANSSVDVEVSAYESEYTSNAGWNLIGNPYLSYFDVSKLGIESTITVWDNNTYVAINPADDNYVLSPLQAMFIQVEQSGVVTFDKDGRQTNSYIATSDARVRGALSSNRELYNFTICDGTYSDKTRFVINSNANEGYEIGSDASKFMSTNVNVPQIYTVADGVSYAINERPLANGVIQLGTYFAKDGEYTITAEGIASPVVLVDNLTGNKVVLGDETYSYTFTATAGKNEMRFVIYVGEDATAIASVESVSNDDTIYNLQGVRVATPTKGNIYIVNGKKVRY